MVTRNSARSPLKVQPALAVAIMLVCGGLLVGMLWRIHVLLFEAAALIALGLGFRYWPSMVAWFARMPLPHRFAFALIFGCVIAGHFTFDNHKYFPFMPWEIFSNVREEDPVSCREFVATTAAGKTVRLLTEQLFPSIVQFNPPAENVSGMNSFLYALVHEYDRQHSGDPVCRVDLERMSVKLRPAASKGVPPSSCELLKRYYYVSSDHSN